MKAQPLDKEPCVTHHDDFPTSTFTSFPAAHNRPKRRIIASILLDASIEQLRLSHKFVHNVGSPSKLPKSAKNFGYRIMADLSPAILPKNSELSGVKSRNLEWETMARARKQTAELLTRIILDTSKGHIIGLRNIRDTEARPESLSSEDEGALLLQRNRDASKSAPVEPLSSAQEEEEEEEEEEEAGLASTSKESLPSNAKPAVHRAPPAAILKKQEMNPRLVPEVALVYIINAWHPSQVIGFDEGTDVLTLRMRGHSQQFDQKLTRSDPRLRQQFNVLKEAGSTNRGYFAKQNEFVMIYVFDLVEAEFFLSTGQIPVGRIVTPVPEHDVAEVEVIGLCCTENLRVSNIHMAKIEEGEYTKRANRILDARDEALRQVDSALHEREAVVVWKKVMTISNERCLASALDKTTSLIVRVVDLRSKKRMECDVSWEKVSRLTDIKLDDDVFWGDLESDEKRQICQELSKFFFVQDGTLTLCPYLEQLSKRSRLQNLHLKEPQETDGTAIATLEKTLEGVPISVTFRDTLETMLVIVSTYSHKLMEGKSDMPRTLRKHVIVVKPKEFDFLGHSNLHWQTLEEKILLCQRLLDSLIGLEGVPVLKLKKTVKFPLNHRYFSECLEEGWTMTGCDRAERLIWAKPSKDAFPYFRKLGEFWESKAIYPSTAKAQISQLNIQKGSDLDVEARRKNMLHARASVEKGGILSFSLYHIAKQKMHNIKCSVDDWYKLGYGPLEWMSWEMRVFLCERICSGLYWEWVSFSNHLHAQFRGLPC